jgi:hypothetical protein
MKQDRFLVGIIIGIGVLVLLSLILFFARRGSLTYGPEDQPDGVLRNYVIALQKQDFDRAYSYLADFTNKPEPTTFRQVFVSQAQQVTMIGFEVVNTNVYSQDNQAIVQVNLVHGSSGLFDQNYREGQSAELVKQNGVWKIRSMPYPFWSYDWGTGAKTVPAEPVMTDTPLSPTPTP